jgi:hypothetical protein
MLSQAQSAGATEFSMPSTPGTDALIRHQETGYKYFGYYKDRGGMAPNHTSVGSLRYYEVIKEAYSMWGGIDLSEKRYYYTYGGGTGLSSFYSTRDNGLK